MNPQGEGHCLESEPQRDRSSGSCLSGLTFHYQLITATIISCFLPLWPVQADKHSEGEKKAKGFDHVATIKALRHGDAKAGRGLYALHCAACHGPKGELAINPLARRFAADELKYGGDPYSLWKTISYGNGLMFRWDAVLSPKERYQIVHHIREEIIKSKNPDQYVTVDEDWYTALPARADADAEAQSANQQRVAVAQGMIDGSGGKQMKYGSFLQHSLHFTVPKDKNAAHMPDTTERAMLIRLGNDLTVAYDLIHLSVAGIWNGKLANTDKSHHTSYKGSRALMPGGDLRFKSVDQPGWFAGGENGKPLKPEYVGHYVSGDEVMLHYRVADRDVYEIPRARRNVVVERHIRVGAGQTEIVCPAIHQAPHGKTAPLTFKASDTPNIQSRFASRAIHPAEFESIKQGGPPRWPEPVQTAIAEGEPHQGYVADRLRLPFANPWGSWLRTTAIDFFSDGRFAVSTLSGDVLVGRIDAKNPLAIHWQRFATGLYEPLGMRVVDDRVYVRGRDRITRLHDLNDDGEADYYENFFEDEHPNGASYHAFIFDLQTDRGGNFYFAQGGYKTPLRGGVVRIDSGGRNPTFIGNELRNPNGMGAGGPQDWVTVADNPSDKAIFNGFALAEPGAMYGFKKDRTVPMLVVLPARVDSSSGSQCWSDPQRWGPWSGSVVHTSYSRCTAFTCFLQDVKPYPNGFAIALPFELQSGAMRARVNPVDGQMYILCHKGWDTKAPYDGAIYRIRHVGGTTHLITSAAATPTGIRIGFGCELDSESVKREAVSGVREGDKKKEGPVDKVKIGEVQLVDARTLHVELPGIEREQLAHRTRRDDAGKVVSVKVNPAISLTVTLRAADGTAIEQTLHATINSLPAAD